MRKLFVVLVILILLGGGVWLVARLRQPQIGKVKDEALASGRAAESFPAADEDYFHDMDGGATLTTAEVRGRNTWIVWSAGNDVM